MKRNYCLLILFLLLIAPYNVFSQYTWSNVALGGGGMVTGIITSKTQQNLVYARTDVGGAYRWDNTNSKWIPLLDWSSDQETTYQGVEALALDPQNSSKVYILAGTSYFNGGKTAILRSSDYGNTFSITNVTSSFTAHGNGDGRGAGERLAVDPNNSNILLCGTRANGLWKSTDAGATWSLLWNGVTTTANGNGICFVMFDGSSVSGGVTQRIFVGVSRTGSSNLYMSTNGGTSFTAIASSPTTVVPIRSALSSDGNLYITYSGAQGPYDAASGTIGKLYKYNIAGATMTNVSPSTSFGYAGISIDPNNPSRLIASTYAYFWSQYTSGSNIAYGDRFFLSTNGGSSWTDLVGSGITLNNNGIPWINGNAAHAIHYASSIEFDPYNTAKAWVTSGNGLFSCSNLNTSPTTWLFDSKGIEETVPLDAVSIAGGTFASALGDVDGCVQSDITAYVKLHNPEIGTTPGIAYAALSTSKLLRVGGSTGAGNGRMYYSTDKGATWIACYSAMNGYQGKVAISADGSTFLHCPTGSSATYRSINNGGSWATTGLNIANAFPVADMVNTNKFYVYNNSTGAMWVSTNAGVSFAASGSAGTGGAKRIQTVPGNEGHIWIAMYGGGLKRSINSGAAFTTPNSAVTYCGAVGLGKTEPSATYPTVYIWGTIGGITGIYRSIDQGANWTRINDDAHEWGGPGNGEFVLGDWNTYGRVYMSTVGRGVVYGDAPATATIPVANFSANTTTPCIGGTVIFTDASTGTPTSWSWNFGSGASPATATGVGPHSVTYSTTGSKTVSLTATNALGSNLNTKTNYITVTTVPSAAGAISGPTSVCASSTGQVYSITAVTGATGYSWTVPTGATITGGANTTSITVSFGSTAGNVSVTPTNTCGNGTSNSLTVSLSQSPTTANAGSVQTVCTTGATLAANTASVGTGAWSVISGTGSFSNASSATSTVSGLSSGANTLRWTISNAPCTASTSDVVINVTTSGAALPLSEGFENATFPPTGWTISNPGGGRTFVRNTTVGGDGLSTNSTQVRCFGYTASNGIGDKDILESPALNLSGLSSATMTFKVAYAYYKQGVTNRWDSLNVYVSADCGAYTKLYNKGRDLLETVAETNSEFTTPGSTQWRTETIDLSAYIGASVVRVRFEVVNGNGNNLYLDDINITGVVSSTAVANFSKSASNVCQGSSVTYTNTSTGTISSYAWDFGAGASPATANTVGPHNVTYSSSGTKTITLTVNGSIIKTDNVTITATPSAPTVSTPVTYCQNATASALTATGTSLLWYTVPSGGVGSATAPTPVTTTAGTTNYYVSQTVSSCESARATLAVTITAPPSAPTVSTPVTYCQNATATALTATGTSLLWYTVSSGGVGSATAPIPSTTTAGTTNYYVSQTVSSCESARATLAVTITATPSAPTVSTPVIYCQNATASALTATGTSLLWYTVSSGGVGSATAPTPSTTTAGTTNYYVSQIVSSCESARATIAVTITATPSAPTVSTPVTYCQNATATALTATGTSILWYTVSSGGAGSATAPTPSTTTAGTTNYYVSQTVSSCESSRATIAVVVGAPPSAPTVSTPVNYCQNATATALTATGTSLLWYTVSSGGVGSATAPTPSTTTAGTTNYYVSQTVSSCESARATIAVVVGAPPSTPTVSTPVTYCQNATATALTATGSGLLWYTVSSGGVGSAAAPTPATTTAGTTNYYVSQTVGCESARATIAVTITAAPSAPTVSSPVTYCQNATASALTATGTSLLWYTVSSGGVGSATAPTPSTTTAGTTNYYVSQTVSTCESARATIAVTIIATPSAPTVSTPVTYCQNATASVLTATGTSLKWYTVSSGGVGSATAPTPSTTTAGTTNYYVSQTVSSCESARATIAVTINATPSAPTVSTPVTYCQNATATALTATGTSLLWYTVSSGGIGSATAPTPVTTTAGTTNYYVSQTVSSCESARATLAVTINATPSAPTVSTPVTYCQNATASVLTATGTSLKWYTVSSGGVGSATAPTPVTTTAGTTNYYVSQTVSSCESARATIAVTINATSSAPTVSTPVTYCQNATASALTATGTSLLWYTVSSGGVGSATAPTPVTTTAGTTNYYVSQTVSSCESARATIAVTVNATPSVPTVSTPVTYCQNATASALTATGTSLLWYTVSSGGVGSAAAPTPSTTTAGTTNYYVSQTVSSCESARATIAVTITATPSTPTVSTPVTYCQNATASALTATGTSLLWYTVSSGGVGSATAPTPVTTTAGTTNYYVSQTVSSCESARATIAVNITATPSTPTVSTPVTYCQNATASALTATGPSLLWYTVSSGGIGSATAPTPVTTTAGTTNYYVSQTVSSCESSRATLAVVVNPVVISNAGNNQFITSTSTTLAGNNPSPNSGTWTVISGTGSFNNAASYNTTVSGLSTGSNIFKWTVNNGVCTSSSSQVTINVSTAPVSQPINGNQYVTPNSQGVTYSVSNNVGSTYTWTVPSGATIVSGQGTNSIIVNFGTQGGTVGVTESNSFGGAASSATITMGNAPVTQTLSGPANVASGTSGVTYSLPNNAGSTYTWTVPSGVTIVSGQGTNSIVVNFGTQGGTVGVTEANSFGNAASSATIAVGNAPVAQTISGPSNVVSGTSGVTYSLPNDAGSTYTWTVPSGATIVSGQGTNSIVVNFGTQGGTVGVTESNSFGSAASSAAIAVGNVPVTQTLSGPANVASGTSGVTYSLPNNAGSTYTWTVPSGATIVSGQGTNSIVVDFGSQGGTVGVTETSSFGSASSSATVNVGSAPVSQSISGSTNVNSNSQGITYSVTDNLGSTYNWSVPTGAIIVSGQGTNTIVVDFGTQGGTVGVTETNSFGNSSSSVSVSVNIASAIFSAANSLANVIVYPNPFSEEINITFNTSSAINMTLKVIDMKGEVVYESGVYQTNQKINLGKELPVAGIYTVIAIYDNKMQIVKVEKVEN